MLELTKKINFSNLLQLISILCISLLLTIQYRNMNINDDVTSYLIDFKRVLFIPFIASLLCLGIMSISLINKREMLRFFTGYIGLNIIYYCLIITRNLNNPEFNVSDFQSYIYLDAKAGLIICVIALIALLTRYYLQRKQVELSYRVNVNKDFLIATLLMIFIIEKSEFLNIFFDSLSGFLTDNIVTYFIYWVLYLLLSIISILLVTLLSLKSLDEFKDNRTSPYHALSFSMLLAVLFNYLFQAGIVLEESLLDRYIFPAATLYQIILLSVIFYVTYVLFNRFLAATLINIIAGLTLSIINHLKFQMRNEPLLITDFVWLKQANLIVSFVDARILLYTVFFIVLTIVLYFILHKKLFPGKIFISKKTRILSAILIICFGTSVHYLYSNIEQSKVKENIPVLSKVNNWIDIKWLGFTKNAGYKSLLYVWTKQLTNSIMDKPENYGKSTIAEIVDKYSKRADEINIKRTQNLSQGTLIYILSESFSDPQKIEGVEISREIIPNIKSIMETTTSGQMRSDAYGGGTANMEFQALTGLPLYNFSPTVSTIYTEVAPQLDIFPSISDQFNPKNRIAIHPQNGANYMRNSIYDKLGFSKFYSRANTDDILHDVSNLGVNISDESVYNAILDNLDPDESQFFSVITMQNHVPWQLEEPSDILAKGHNFTEIENDNLTNYSRLLYETDKATKDFLDSLSQIEHEVTVVFYGDHLPSLYPQDIFNDNEASQYQTEYFIWNNKKHNKLNYPLLNSSDFSAAVLEHTNSKVSPFYALMTDVLQHVSVDKDIITKEQEQILEDLNLIQYDITAGKGYLAELSDFFELQ